MSEALPLAAVLLAQGGADAGLAPMLEAVQAAGARPVVVVLARDAAAPEGVRVARVGAGASRMGALRAGMALLTNTAARLALVWPCDDAASIDAGAIVSLVDRARDTEAAVTALADRDLDRSPVVVARDAWLELMTLGEQGMDAVAAKRGISRV